VIRRRPIIGNIAHPGRVVLPDGPPLGLAVHRQQIRRREHCDDLCRTLYPLIHSGKPVGAHSHVQAEAAPRCPYSSSSRVIHSAQARSAWEYETKKSRSDADLSVTGLGFTPCLNQPVGRFSAWLSDAAG
jgi:hypothetical protein